MSAVQRLLDAARGGPGGAALSALSGTERAALARLLERVEAALGDGDTLVEETLELETAFDAAERVARDAAGPTASAAVAGANIARAIGLGFDSIDRSVFVLRGERGARRISTARTADDERRLARALLERAATVDAPRGSSAVAAAPAHADLDPEQRQAVERALRGGLLLLTGGPGTGKTRTIGAMVAALAADASRDEPVHVLAPTGRAAARLREALGEERRRRTVDPAGPPEQERAVVATIHAALRWQPTPGAPFGHDAHAPLRTRAVIVDECSMVDLSLMRRLVDAVPATAALVLVGDADQLASIDAGNVFADLCSAPQLAHATVRLQRNHRSAGDARAAWLDSVVSALRAGDADAVVERLRGARALIEPSAPGDATRRAAEIALPEYRAMMDLARRDPGSAFDAMRRFRVLAAARRGDGGVESIARRLDERLVDGGAPNPIGRQVMVLRNEPDAGLANGDLGVVVGGGVHLGFDAHESPRTVPLGALPEHQAAWAISIHKSQGSEFDRVLVTLPDDASRLLSRQLLYTALTRSRGDATIVARESSVRAAVERTAARCGGLRHAIDDARPFTRGDATPPGRRPTP